MPENRQSTLPMERIQSRCVAMAKKRSFLYRNFGYFLLAGTVVLLFARDVGPIAVSGAFALPFLWLLLAAPLWCGATNRGEGYCRSTSSGLLGGCKRVRDPQMAPVQSPGATGTAQFGVPRLVHRSTDGRRKTAAAGNGFPSLPVPG
jgi:hypothetical protein